MRINPRTITLDANERNVITGALVGYAKEMARKAKLCKTDTDRGRAAKHSWEMREARATDLLKVMA
jgi:hypothetical protein